MAPLKRKRRPSGEIEGTKKPTISFNRDSTPSSTILVAPLPPLSRRATRQTSLGPPPSAYISQPDPEPRRRGRRTDSSSNDQPPVFENPRKLRSPRGKENVPVDEERKPQPLPKKEPSRHPPAAEAPATVSTSLPTVDMALPRKRPPGRPRLSAAVTAVPPVQETQLHISATSRAANGVPNKANKANKNKVGADRNIDMVMLGDKCFPAKYPSYYGKDVLGDASSKNSDAIISRLYVCPWCFKYSKEVLPWYQHMQLCKQKTIIPGKKIYTHPKGQRIVQRPSTEFLTKPSKGRKITAVPRMVSEIMQDDGEWSIWEVDGDVDVLFCQNLSLFAKLFLDNKSVFFDVTGFNYFLLVHTPGPHKASSTSSPNTDTNSSPSDPTAATPRSQVVGFFSKEKMSWDNNNVACILVFPPWWRKGLGALLIGVSYEISRREQILGGPEKPISDLGKKAYKRFWAGEIARWILSLEPSPKDDETVIDINECSNATWIATDDCLTVLREMGVAEEAGKGPCKRTVRALMEPSTEEVDDEPAPEVNRVKISQNSVMVWIEKNKISLDKPCDPTGFIEGYAMKQDAAGEESG